MANINNLTAGLFGFVASAALAYALWAPVSDLLSGMDGALYVLMASSWVLFLLIAGTLTPIILLNSDDKGN